MGKSSWSERFWVAVLIVGIVIIVGMLGWLVYPYAVEYLAPPTPSPEPGRAVVREVPFSLEEEGGCIDGPVLIGSPEYEPYVYSAVLSLENMGLWPEIVENVAFAWLWTLEDGLEYSVAVNGTIFEFAIDCFLDIEGEHWLRFDTVEIRQPQEAP